MDKQEMIDLNNAYKKTNVVGIRTNKGIFCIDCHVYEREKTQY